jgi:hypothetical protein
MIQGESARSHTDRRLVKIGKKMRNKMIVSLLCTFIMLVMPVSSIFAMENNIQLPPDMDVGLLRIEIADKINSYEEGPFAPPRKVTKEDIDFSNIFKFYVDTDIFSVQTNSFEEMTQILEKGNCMFELIVFVDEVVYEVDLSRGLPVDKDKVKDVLTEAQIKNLESEVGKWIVPGISYFDSQTEYIDYYKIAMEMADVTDKQPLLVGGLPSFHYPVALFSDENGNIGKIVPIYHNAIPWEDLGLEPQDGDVVLDYTEIKEIVNEKSKSWLDSILPGKEDAGNGKPDQGATVQSEEENSANIMEGTDIETESPLVSNGDKSVWAIVIAAIAAVPAATAAILIVRRRKAEVQSAPAPEMKGEDS